MTCAVSYKRRRFSEVSLRAGDAPKKLVERRVDLEVAGTWDFKWPLGTRIRVAFQRPPLDLEIPEEDFAEARRLVEAYAQRWHDFLPESTAFARGISFDFQWDPLDPPLGPGVDAVARHRSSFTRETLTAVPYDVLISLEPLPVVTQDPFRGPGREEARIIAPLAELGSYSRRADYGAPTVYLGPFGRYAAPLIDGVAASEVLLDYLRSPLGQNVVVHEFGHVLGLPHLHQHPELIATKTSKRDVKERLAQLDEARRGFFKSAADIKAQLRELLDIDIEEPAVAEQILNTWRGNLSFSDWIELTDSIRRTHETSGALESIMTLPYYACLKRGHQPCKICGSHDLSGVLTTPQALDAETLALMYGPPLESSVVSGTAG